MSARAIDPPPSGPNAWPYVAPETGRLPSTLPSGKPWPLISVVTPIRNQGKYVEEAILSVLHQGYPNVEHIIIDGASTDETVAVLENYRSSLARAVSEPDNGQSHAINKGMGFATGEILTWLNGDDMLAPGALASVALAFDTHQADVVAGICQIYRDGRLLAQHLTSCADGPLPLEDLLDLEKGWLAGQFFYQPEVMFTRDIWQRSGGRVDERLFYSMDYELWLRFARSGARLHVVGRPLARFRVHEQQKTHAVSNFLPELAACRDAFLKENGFAPSAPPARVPERLSLRITLLNDIGGYYGAGIAHVRLARALAWAGHKISLVAILDKPAHGLAPLYTMESVLDRVSASNPDLVIVGNLHNANADPVLLNLLSERFPTVIAMHDLWMLTGRCAYTGSCEQYLTGCTEHCPTPDEYPALPPAEIPDAWFKKRLVLSAKARPALLANSHWTAAFARRALAYIEQFSSIDVIRLSFPLDLFRRFDRRHSREVLGLPLDRYLVLVPASLDEPRKGVRPYLDALARLDLPDLTAIILGKLSEAVAFPVEVIQMGYMHEPGKIAMLNSAVDVVVVPSSVETFGQVFIEAIACGTVVAGYPVAAIPEAIRDGVTGILAADCDPASLAAVTNHLYHHRELRDDFAQWGRLYVENEWSEASAYRQFFLALQRLGLCKSLDLCRKIELLPVRPPLPLLETVCESSSAWRPRYGFSPVKRTAGDDHRPGFRYAVGPTALAEISVEAPGAYTILIVYRNAQEHQRLTLQLNGSLLATHELQNTGFDADASVEQHVTLDSVYNRLYFEFSVWYAGDANEGRLAAIVSEIRVESANDSKPKFPSSQEVVAAIWGQREIGSTDATKLV